MIAYKNLLMKNFKTVSNLIFAFLLFANIPLVAQDSCNYRLQLIDSAGDGWNDSQLYLKLGNNPEKAYTHDGRLARPSDSLRIYDFKVRIGDTLIVRYDPQGSSQSEISFTLFNNAGESLVAKGPSPTSGQVYKGAVRCAVCGGALEAKVASIRTFSTTIAWKSSPISVKPTYRIVWDTANFSPWVRTPSRGFFETTDTFAVLQGLTEITKYYAYVRSTCVPPTDTSGWVGPLSFITDTATNVGISKITGPVGSCNLGNSTVVTVSIKNYGGGPKSLIPLKYSVNGVVAPVAQPSDGFYTGVISRDSTVSFAFKATWNFSQPGDYNIAAWTELEGDKNIKNDTFRTTITKPRLINQFPYQQSFENGKDTWSVIDLADNSTWALGTPNYLGGRFISGAASGTKAWTTAPDTSYKNNDTSYLVSPCFDFSGFTADPNVSFALNFYSQQYSDGAWLEGSIDGGTSWKRIGSRTSGVNWYSDTLSNTNLEAWTGTNRLGWKIAQHPLTGFAGKPQSRFRFVFQSDNLFNQNFDGIAIDNFAISAPNAIDLAIDSVGRIDKSDCGNLKDSVVVRVFNLGSVAQNVYTLSYRLDNNTVVTENITLNIAPGKSILYKFTSPLNTFVNAGTHRINAWVTQAADGVRVNDTAYTTFSIAPPVRGAIAYNFSDGFFPQNWQRLRGIVRISGHGNNSTNGYIYANIHTDTAIVNRDTIITPNAQIFDVTTNKFGIIRNEDSLRYDYRFVNQSEPYSGYDLITRDTFKVMVAEECGNNWVVVDAVSKGNHTPTTAYRNRGVSLRQFAGKTVKVRFLVTSLIDSLTGYFFDLDNIQYKSICPTELGLRATIKNITPGLNNGEITVVPSKGVSPYTYKWSNDSTRSSITKLIAGNYTVTVTDGNGCLDVVTYSVNLISATFDPTSTITKVTLAPNPTTGTSVLNVTFAKITDAKIQVINIMGQVLNEQQSKQSDHAQFDLDLSDKPAGIYLIRITTDNKTHVARLLKQ
jgi:Secretion system C-terminal sorting domain